MTDRFDAMRVFVAVCDAQGFAAAARRLDLAPSVVTRLVAGLEEHLGVRLLQRTTRTVRLTDAGARFLERTRRILADVEEAELAAQDESAAPRGRLVVAAPMLFGRLHVAPVLSALLDAHPQLSAELVLSDGYANLIESGIDVAVRIGDLADSSLVARRLGRTRRVLVAAPAYLAAHGGAPRVPADLPGHKLIAFRPTIAGREWSFRDARGGVLRIDAEAGFATNSGDAAIAHALAGGGITGALSYQVDAALRAGTLVEVLRAFGPPPVPIQAVFPTARLLPSKVRAFLDLAERRAAAWQFDGLPDPPA